MTINAEWIRGTASPGDKGHGIMMWHEENQNPLISILDEFARNVRDYDKSLAHP